MKTRSPNTSFQNNRSGMFETLLEMNPRLRFVVGLLACAVIAYYIPSFLIALTGVWVNNLTMTLPLLVGVIILVVQSLMGNKLNKPFLVAAFFALVIDGYETYFLIHTASSWAAFRVNWMVFFLPTAALLLNAWLLGKYKAATSLT